MRLFTALDLPVYARTWLGTLSDTRLAGARWLNPESLHLTLNFIGEVDDDLLDDLLDALDTVQAAPFPLQLAGVGRFPPSEQKAARVLWAGVMPNKPLMRLQADTAAAIQGAGFPLDDPIKPYTPHVTLARMKPGRTPRELNAYLRRHADAQVPAFTVGAFHLYRSDLSPKGAVYTLIETFPLELCQLL